jgi:type IV pilus assembly protein PilE
MKKTKGFTLVELVIVIVIVGILSIVAVPIYRGYTRKAMASEGKALLGSIQTSEKIYYAEFGSFYSAAATGYNATLDVDARANKYFSSYTVAAGANTFSATTTGHGGATGISLTLSANASAQPTTAESGI